MTDNPLQSKLSHLREIIASFGRVAIAYSGGVDSVFLLKIAADVLGPENTLAVLAQSPSLAARESEDAHAIARKLGVTLVVVEPGEFDDPRYLENTKERCYFCKEAAYRRIIAAAAERGFDRIICGTNVDDLGDFRPGHRAADELGVRSPCTEAGLTKADIRALSAEMGLPTAGKPATPCLASRVPYGEPITPEKMRMIEAAEAVMHELGIPECRVRHHGDLARIEVSPDRIETLAAGPMRQKVETALREIGYRYIALDLRGFRSGSLNEAFFERE